MIEINEVPRPTWLEVDLGAIKNNVMEIRRLIGENVEILGVVKANAYGHGLKKIAGSLLDNGANRLGVATLGEGVLIRKVGIDAPVLVLGFVAPEQAEIAIENDITQTVYSYEIAENISKVAQKLGKIAKIHLKIDTGMGRIGFLPMAHNLDEIAKIADLPSLEIEGIYTHFACADEKNKAFTITQHERFLDFINRLKQRGIDFPIVHMANSAALIDMPETRLDMVRPGIILYGHYPSVDVSHDKINLIPAITLKARVSFVKKVPPATTISYGGTYVATEERVIASLPLGYADGFPRAFSNRGEVLIHGKKVRVVGNVCMDQIMVDVTDLDDVKIGDEAVIIGKQGDEMISLEDFAAMNNTINYEIICSLSERIPRIYAE